MGTRLESFGGIATKVALPVVPERTALYAHKLLARHGDHTERIVRTQSCLVVKGNFAIRQIEKILGPNTSLIDQLRFKEARAARLSIVHAHSANPPTRACNHAISSRTQSDASKPTCAIA